VVHDPSEPIEKGFGSIVESIVQVFFIQPLKQR
jgi:hypothetical protein